MSDFKLDSSPKIKSGFRTPESYFDTFSLKVIQQLPAKEQAVFILPRRKKLLWFAAAAAICIGLMVPVANYFNNPVKQLDEATLESYLSYQTNLNQFDLINELDSSDVNHLNKNLSFEDKSVEDFLAANPNIENYIIE